MICFPRVGLSTIVLLAFFGCSKQEKIQPQPGTHVQRSTDNVAEVGSVEKRNDLAANFSWSDSTGRTVSLDDFRGRVVLINFWATWCGPCKRELPDLVALSRELGDKQVTIIGVSTDRGANVIEDVRSFVHDQGIPYQIVVANQDLEEAYGNIRALPTSFILNAEGKIVKNFVGIRTKEFLSQAIAEAGK